MKYIFVDTNNFIACALMTEPKHSPDTIEKLRKLLNSNKIKLLLPEVVEIEFFRKVDEELFKLENSIKKFSKIINEEFPTYLKSEKTNFLRSVNRIIKKRRESSDNAKEYIKSLFEEKNSIKIAITPEISINAYKRVLAGKKTYKFEQCSECDELKNKFDNDCLIFESLLSEIKKLGKIEIIFCSGNIKDFAFFNESKKKHILHPDLETSLPKGTSVKYYRNLVNALNSEFKTKIQKVESEKIKNYLDYTYLPSSFRETAISLKGLPLMSDAVKHSASKLSAISDSMINSVSLDTLNKLSAMSDTVKHSVSLDKFNTLSAFSDAVKHSASKLSAMSDAVKNIASLDTPTGLSGLADLKKGETLYFNLKKKQLTKANKTDAEKSKEKVKKKKFTKQ